MASWKTIANGVEYQDIAKSLLTPWSHIHTFRIDLNLNKLSIIAAKNLGKELTSVDEVADKTQSILAINAGFFDDRFQPLGLRVSQFQQLKPLKNISWWGVFSIQHNTAKISSFRNFNKSSSTEFAIQAGPRLLVGGMIPKLKAGSAQRTAIGIQNNHTIIILVTDNAPLSTQDLAELMNAPPLSCTDAINLDGGSSTQLYANLRDTPLTVHGFANIPDAIVVLPKDIHSLSTNYPQHIPKIFS